METPKELFEVFEKLAQNCHFELDLFEEKIMIHARDTRGIGIDDESEFWDIFSEWVHKNIDRFHLNMVMNE